MLQPKRTKFRKAHKGRIHGNAKGGTALNFGSYGLKAVGPARVTARQIEAYFAGKLKQFDLPLRAEGTPFRKKVWQALREVPYGQTRSYGEIAREVDSAPRAVGGACGANPIPILIPCHRVIGAGGRMTGYSGGEGIETKLALLRLEGYRLL